MSTTNAAGLGGDMLKGAGEISEFLFVSATERRKVYHLASTGVLPCFNIGAIVCARRSVLLQWVADQEAKGTRSRSREAA